MKIYKINAVALALGFLLLQSQALASGSKTNYNPLHVSGGIAMPASSTAVHSNPAGIITAPTAVVLQAGAPKIWDNGTYRAGLQTNGSSWGVAGGIEDQTFGNNNGNNNSNSSSLLAYYGMAVGTESFTLGLAGRTGISNSSGTALNVGLLFGVGSSARVGMTAWGINSGAYEWGAGAAFGVGQGFDLVLDAAADSNLANLQIKPGVKVSGSQAALTLSYGTGARAQFADGFTAGASFIFASNNTLELQYNAGGALSKYFAALTIGL